MTPNKAIILIGDGMGDRPVASLGGKTPLEAQPTPSLDAIASGGVCGLMDPVSPGVRVGSDTAHLALLGYDPFTSYTGRGPFEARGVGVDVRPGDLAFRCNFSTVENGLITDRRAGRIKEGTQELADTVMAALAGGIDGVEVIFMPSVEHRAVLVLRGEGLDPRISDVDPHHEGAPIPQCLPLPEATDSPAAQRTALIVNEFVQVAHRALDASPVNVRRRAEGLKAANVILPRGVGIAPNLQPFAAKYGISGAIIVEVDLIKGLGKYLQMDVLDVARATGGSDTDELAIAKAVAAAWESHDFILCNIKAPDLGGHDSSPEPKMAAIAKVDRAAGYLLETLDWTRTVMAVTADHCTPISVGDHSGDSVPIAVYGTGVRPDDVSLYGERPCARGDLGHIRGGDVMNLLTNYTGTQVKFGA